MKYLGAPITSLSFANRTILRINVGFVRLQSKVLAAVWTVLAM